MATKPPVNPIKELDLRSINNALNLVQSYAWQTAQVSEQALLIAGQNRFNASQATGGLAQVQQQLTALQNQLATLAAGSLAPTATYRADLTCASFDPVVVSSDGGVSPVDTQDPTQIFGCIGIATSNAVIGAPIVVRRSGVLVGAGVGWEAGRAVYAEIGSGLTQWPSYAAVALPVGVAINATDLEVRTGWPALREKPLYGGDYEDFMPVTLQLVRVALELIDSLAGQPDGYVVKIGDVMTTRVLVAGSGSGVTIENGDGVDGDTLFSVP